MATYQQGHKSQTYENVETPKDVGAYIFTVAIVNRFFFTVVSVLVKSTETGTFW